MVGEAYQNGIEFFIHKPINRVEVEHVLSKVNDQWKYERYVLEIKQSMARLNLVEAPAPAQGRTVRDAARSILMDLGISEKVVARILWLSWSMRLIRSRSRVAATEGVL